ncbi:MAG TPA: threonyl-tRNA synthetase editing domain-containing protein [Salinivirga sp.]|uniref:threonyl-tRNA synthetase editing domain-containing protein n=1 Tax=Salinivirga sp. TaxID=1970192 RepID=UPI002B47DB9E|nr:threonyl-tRNA synthetase editing domain-containing protein [Salinivirga sp.]HKK58577.1 threonyl-tRNA synthetase editing domain-containing protein [Salinivirga sp.]
MKLLLIYANNFGYTPTTKTLEDAEDHTESHDFEKVQTAFIQAEAEDADREADVTKKLVKNLKWIMKKNEAETLILHSFAHLSESKADPDLTKAIFDKAEEKMKNAGYTVHQTPFGYFLDLRLDAPGFSLARVFKDL